MFLRLLSSLFLSSTHLLLRRSIDQLWYPDRAAVEFRKSLHLSPVSRSMYDPVFANGYDSVLLHYHIFSARSRKISSGTHLRFIGWRGTCQSTFGFFRQHEHTQTN